MSTAAAIAARSRSRRRSIRHGSAFCHCTDCQKLTGTAFRLTVGCPEHDFHILRGTPKIYIKVADSGRRRQNAFCGDCGSQLYSTSDEVPGNRIMGLRTGTLNQRQELVPHQQIFFRSALRWLPELPGEVHEGE